MTIFLRHQQKFTLKHFEKSLIHFLVDSLITIESYDSSLHRRDWRETDLDWCTLRILTIVRFWLLANRIQVLDVFRKKHLSHFSCQEWIMSLTGCTFVKYEQSVS